MCVSFGLHVRVSVCELPVRMWPAATNAKRFDTHRLRSRSRHRPTLRRVTESEREIECRERERAGSREQAGWQGQKRHIKHASIDTLTHTHAALHVHFQFANFHWKPKWRRAARSRRRSWTERRLQAGAVCRGVEKEISHLANKCSEWSYTWLQPKTE